MEGAVPTLVDVGGVEYRMSPTCVDPEIIVSHVCAITLENVVGRLVGGEDIGEPQALNLNGYRDFNSVGAVVVVCHKDDAYAIHIVI